MQVDIWVDLGCPWSYLGFRHLRTALASFPHSAQIEVAVHPFFLEPDLEARSDTPWLQRLIENDGMEPAEALALRERLIKLGRAEGISLDLDRMVIAPTAAAFRVILAAREIDWGRGSTHGADTTVLKITDALFRARFEMGLDLSDADVLIGCAQDVGIRAEDVVLALSDEAVASQVWSDYQVALHMGVTQVPTMLLARAFVVTGMQPVTAVTNAVTTAWAQAHPGDTTTNVTSKDQEA